MSFKQKVALTATAAALVGVAGTAHAAFQGRDCPRRSNIDPPCRSNIDPGMDAGRVMAGCGQV